MNGDAPLAAPLATYRLQFSAAFTFDDARQIVPYLAALGASHVYASPFLKARSGSTHGYDIIDHNMLNPELGDETAFRQFVDALHDRGMGLILDFVPNHMGVAQADNQWWLDVLEYGTASPYAAYFDIDWFPPKQELRGKVLMPILGDHYGAILDRGELTLSLDAASGSISIWYHEHRLPVSPRIYWRLLQPAANRVRERDPEDRRGADAFFDLAQRFRELGRRPPGRRSLHAEAEQLKSQLTSLLDASPWLCSGIDETLSSVSGGDDRPPDAAELHRILEAQSYRIAYWRVAAHEINYRRFFDINDLAGLRVERPEVFEATHRRVLEWAEDGTIDGLRIDHIDGLYDPAAYCRRLAARIERRPFYIVVEKILAPHEHLREDWPIAGTTGYEFLNQVNGLFIDPESEKPLDRIYRRFTDRQMPFDAVVRDSKRRLLERELVSELNVLAGQIDRIAEANPQTRDYTLNGLKDALAEIVAHFTVYRTYVNERGASPDDRRDIEWAVSGARKASTLPDLSIFDFLQAALTTDLVRRRRSGYPRNDVVNFAMKFQQYTGPMMAKSMEDTAFYRFPRLLSLNEVGGDPRHYSVSPRALSHACQERSRRWPHTMLGSATHDTKRGEDVRARLNVLSEIPEEWGAAVRRWSRLNRRHKTSIDERAAPSPNDEYLLYQTLVGAWPCELLDGSGSGAALESFRDRIVEYARKAVREAKLESSWTSPDPAYEAALSDFVVRTLDPARGRPFLESVAQFVTRIAVFGMLNGLCQLLVKLTSPGVPDIYQGCELWDLSLVDPDNRRPVDYGARSRMLHALDTRSSNDDMQLAGWRDGSVKLALVRRMLQLRKRYPGLFLEGEFIPLGAEGERAEHVFAFARRHNGTILVVAVPRLVVRLTGGTERLPLGHEIWKDTAISLPDGFAESEFVNFANGAPAKATCDRSGRMPLADLLAAAPIAAATPGNSR